MRTESPFFKRAIRNVFQVKERFFPSYFTWRRSSTPAAFGAYDGIGKLIRKSGRNFYSAEYPLYAGITKVSYFQIRADC